MAIGLSEYPVNYYQSQLFSDQTLFAVLGSGDSVQPFNTVKDFDNFIGRAEGSGWIVLKQMYQGISNGVVLPKILWKNATI